MTTRLLAIASTIGMLTLASSPALARQEGGGAPPAFRVPPPHLLESLDVPCQFELTRVLTMSSGEARLHPSAARLDEACARGLDGALSVGPQLFDLVGEFEGSGVDHEGGFRQSRMTRTIRQVGEWSQEATADPYAADYFARVRGPEVSFELSVINDQFLVLPTDELPALFDLRLVYKPLTIGTAGRHTYTEGDWQGFGDAAGGCTLFTFPDGSPNLIVQWDLETGLPRWCAHFDVVSGRLNMLAAYRHAPCPDDASGHYPIEAVRVEFMPSVLRAHHFHLADWSSRVDPASLLVDVPHGTDCFDNRRVKAYLGTMPVRLPADITDRVTYLGNPAELAMPDPLLLGTREAFGPAPSTPPRARSGLRLALAGAGLAVALVLLTRARAALARTVLLGATVAGVVLVLRTVVDDHRARPDTRSVAAAPTAREAAAEATHPGAMTIWLDADGRGQSPLHAPLAAPVGAAWKHGHDPLVAIMEGACASELEVMVNDPAGELDEFALRLEAGEQALLEVPVRLVRRP